MNTRTRAEHLQWCKDRAIELALSGDTFQAFNSMVSDLNKHEGTEGHAAIQLGVLMMFSNQLDTVDKMIKFIEGFN